MSCRKYVRLANLTEPFLNHVKFFRGNRVDTDRIFFVIFQNHYHFKCTRSDLCLRVYCRFFFFVFECDSKSEVKGTSFFFVVVLECMM